jgi:calcineurin-like phosphoesterase family protein
MSRNKNPVAYFIPNYKDWINKEIFITSDYHGYHKAIAYGSSKWTDRSGCRPFNNEIEMTELLISNTNKVVGPDDVLIDLGDFAFGCKDNIRNFRSRINCSTLIHVNGNHCHHIRQDKELQSLFSWVGDYLEIAIDKQYIAMCHYPMSSYNGASHNGFMLHGHSHHNLPQVGRIIDVGVDGEGYNYSPLDLRQLLADNQHLVVSRVDHH